MKKQIASAVAALFMLGAGSAFAHDPSSTLTAGALGATSVASQVGGTSAASLIGGSSQSGAQSLQSSTLNITASTNVPGGNINGSQTATIGAVGTTSSQGFAYNLSTGAGTGTASMTGTASQEAVGAATTQQVGSLGSPGVSIGPWTIIPGSPASLPYVSSGSASGSESSGSNEAINAGTNQGAAIASVSGGNFGADVGFSTNSGSVSVPAAGNTVTTQDGPGIQLTAGSIGGTYSQTSLSNGVYTDGNAIDFGGNSNQIATTVSGPHGSTIANPNLVSSASGAFGAQSSIDGEISTGNATGLNVQSPLSNQ